MVKVLINCIKSYLDLLFWHLYQYQLIFALIFQHHYSAALFWADKVVSLSGNSPVDMYWLAQCYFLTKQYHRAINLINQHNLTRVSLLDFKDFKFYF